MTNERDDRQESVQQFLQKVNLARMYQLWGRMVEASDLCHQALTLIPTTNEGTCPDGFIPSGKILHGVLRAIGKDKEASKLSLILGKSSKGDDGKMKRKETVLKSGTRKKETGTVRRRLQSHIQAGAKTTAKSVEDTQDTKKAEKTEKPPRRRNLLATRLQEARVAAQRRVRRAKLNRKRRNKLQEKKAKSYQKLQEQREEQLKKFRDAAAERNRKRAREERKRIAKVEAETAARQKRLQELQSWLTQKKEEKHKKITENDEKRRRSFASASDEFGFSTKLKDPEQDRLRMFCGTPAYMAPEIIRGGSYRGYPVDMWAMGIVLYAVVCGRFPFMAKHERALYKKIVAGNFSIPNKSKLSQGLQELIKRLLCVSTTSRITMKDCLRHRWLASVTNFDRNDRKASQYLVTQDDPSRDLNDSTLDKIESYGFRRESVRSAVLNQEKNQFTTTYYLTHANTRLSSTTQEDRDEERNYNEDQRNQNIHKEKSSRPLTSKCDKNNGGGVVILNHRLEDLGLNRDGGDEHYTIRKKQIQTAAVKWDREKSNNLIVTSRPKTSTKTQQQTKKKKNSGVAVKYIGYYRALKDRR